ncbi:MAG TPA: hypothetical protein VM095_11845 [Pyrinomonadaceae bacterium]|nr:hypothetical protein [Pyrinomonadaceae bacterium]
MGRIWALASILCLIAAAIFLWRGYMDTAFVLAAVGALSWMLDYRTKLRGIIPEEAETTSHDAKESEDDYDDEDDYDEAK